MSIPRLGGLDFTVSILDLGFWMLDLGFCFFCYFSFLIFFLGSVLDLGFWILGFMS